MRSPMLESVDRTHYEQDVNGADLFDIVELRELASMGTDQAYDVRLTSIGRAAQSYVEKYVGRPFVKTEERNYWPCLAKVMWMKKGSYIDATDDVFLKYLDGDGAVQTIDEAKYYIHSKAKTPSVRITDEALDIETRENDETAIWVETMTGMDQNRRAMETCRQGARILVQGMWYGGPEATVDVVSPQALQRVKMLIQPYRRRGFV